jgi:Xaa-Pro aminopeptidase
MHESRLRALINQLESQGMEAILLTSRANIRYLSGFSGDESYLFISSSQQVFITDSRYSEQAQRECPLFDIILHQGRERPLTQLVADLCRKEAIRRLAFESKHTSYALFEQLNKALAEQTQLLPSSGMVEKLRYIKSQQEIELLRHACQMTDIAFEQICEIIRPGISEKELAAELLYIIHNLGCDSSFPIIAASGVNGALPHAIPSDKLLANNELLTLDFGCQYQGYHADMTRTVCLGQPSARQKEIYDIVLSAKSRAEQLIKAGVSCSEIDAAARGFIISQGYGDNFRHGLGHGVGLEIHEDPLLNPSATQMLHSGVLVTVEPGIYLPGWGGIRIEDTVAVTDDGYQSLFYSPLELLCL